MTTRSLLSFLLAGSLACAAACTANDQSSAATAARSTSNPAAAAVPAPPAAPGPDGSPDPTVPKDVGALLREIRAQDQRQLAVSEEDGRLLRVLVASSRSQRVLEIGGASGYSAIWMGLGLRETGGHLTTIEYDAERAKELAANIERAGLTDRVTVISGDAFAEIPKLAGTFDMVFLDAWKTDYKRFLDLVLPRLQPGGLFLAHNVVNKRSEMGDFLDAIGSNPVLFSTIVTPSGEGISISYRRK